MICTQVTFVDIILFNLGVWREYRCTSSCLSIVTKCVHSSSLLFLFVLFRRRTTVKMLCIYADYKSDESYTPSKISVRVGNNFHNLQEIRVTTIIVALKLRRSQLPEAYWVSSPLWWSTFFSPSSSSSPSLQQLEMVEPSGWIHISLLNQVRHLCLHFTLKMSSELRLVNNFSVPKVIVCPWFF